MSTHIHTAGLGETLACCYCLLYMTFYFSWTEPEGIDWQNSWCVFKPTNCRSNCRAVNQWNNEVIFVTYFLTSWNVTYSTYHVLGTHALPNYVCVCVCLTLISDHMHGEYVTVCLELTFFPHKTVQSWPCQLYDCHWPCLGSQLGQSSSRWAKSLKLLYIAVMLAMTTVCIPG